MFDNSLQEEILNSQSIRVGNFKVAINMDKYWKYYEYPSEEAKEAILREREYFDGQGLTDREIAPDEIVIETDKPQMAENAINAEVIATILEQRGFAYDEWHSGNKSFHIHIIFPELRMINTSWDRRRLKRLFLKWLLCRNGIKCTYPNHHDCFIYNEKVDWQLTGKHLIRLEQSEHPKTGKRKTLVRKNITGFENKFPQEIWDEFSRSKMKYLQSRSEGFQTLSTMKMDDIPCIKYFYTNAVSDCRKRVAFTLVKNLKRIYGMEKAEELIREWNNKINSKYLTEIQLRNLIEGARRSEMAPSHRYNAELLGELGLHDICKRCSEVTE